MKRILITGATGFVGANLSRQLLSEGHEVHLLLREHYKDWRIQSILKDVQIHFIDLQDVESLRSTIASISPEWIFHLSTYGAYPSQKAYQMMAQTNLVATANLVDVCVEQGFDAFINTGSSSEYGFKDHAPREDECIEPNSMYAITKAAATQYCQNAAKVKKVNLATVRLYSVFGPFEEPTRLIPTIIIAGLQGKYPPLVNPAIARDFVYVDDICRAYIMMASNPTILSGKIYNLGSGVQTSLHEVVNLARKEFSLSAQPAWGSMPDRQWDTSIWVADHSQITTDFGWQPQISFSNGFEKTVEWFRTNPEMLTFYQTHRDALS